METILVDCHVKVNNITFLKWSGVRDTMADDLINGCATAAREPIVVQRRGIATLLDDEFVNNSINFLSCDTHCDGSMTNIKGLSGNS